MPNLAGRLHPLVLSVVVTAAAIFVTRLTWPVFASTPFVPVFGAVFIATHWGSGTAGLLATVLATAGALLFFPTTGSLPWNPITAVVFAGVGLISSRLISGRNRAVVALREREAELRATLDELHASEEAVRKVQKMEAIGQLAAGVAHNFNNLLTVTMGYTDVLLDDDGDDALRQTAISEIRKATERGAILARQMLTFGRKHDPRIARVALDSALGGLREMLTRVTREDITLRIEIEPSQPTVMVDPHDLEQVIVNLVINARDALPEGGDIAVSVSIENVAAGDPRRDPGAAPGEFVCLRVRDNGIGMPPHVQARLFEPFFTTKEVGEGTGLGLAFVHGVAQHGGGFVTVDTAPGRGTTFSFYLPSVPPCPTPAVVEARPARTREIAAATTVLLVEDEDAVREMTARALQRAGYRVLSAASPSEARAVFGRHVADITVLVSDVVMPEMHGPALAAMLVEQRPDLRVLFVSGYSDALPAYALEDRKIAFLPKPYSMASLADAIAALLADDTTGAVSSEL